MAAKKSISQQRKEIRSHVEIISQSFVDNDVGTWDLAPAIASLKSVKQSGLEKWYRDFSQRVGDLLRQNSSDASLVRESMRSIERVIGLQR